MTKRIWTEGSKGNEDRSGIGFKPDHSEGPSTQRDISRLQSFTEGIEEDLNRR